jgi:hypothetical protein
MTQSRPVLIFGVSAAARYVGVPNRVKAANSGKLAFRKIPGSLVQFDAADLDRFIAESSYPAEPAPAPATTPSGPPRRRPPATAIAASPSPA